MATRDLELHQDDEQQQLLAEAVRPAHVPYGRALVLAAAGSAVLVGAALWGGPAIQQAAVLVPKDDMMQAGQQLNKVYAKVRDLTADVPDADLAELENLSCDLDVVDVEICGESTAELDTKCQSSCIKGYRQLVAVCPPGHGYAKDASDRLKACHKKVTSKSMDRDSSIEEQIEEQVQDEMAKDEEAVNELECMPLVFAMSASCHMSEAPTPEALCESRCQESIKVLKSKCAPALTEDMHLDLLTNMCEGCGHAFLTHLGQGSEGSFAKACSIGVGGLEGSKLTPCEAGCKANACELLDQCKIGEPTGIPGVGEKELQILHKAFGEAMEGKCQC